MEKELTLSEGMAFLINACTGAGFLAMPWAFIQGGWCTAGVIAFLSLIAVISAFQILETVSRADVYRFIKSNGLDKDSKCCGTVPLLAQEKVKKYHTLFQPRIEPDGSYEYPKLNLLFLGPVWHKVYLLASILTWQGILTTFAIIFAKSAAINLPILKQGCSNQDVGKMWDPCRVKYWTFLGVYAALVIPLTCGGMTALVNFT